MTKEWQTLVSIFVFLVVIAIFVYLDKTTSVNKGPSTNFKKIDREHKELDQKHKQER